MSDQADKEIDVNDRCAPSDEDDCELSSIEINFAIPTYLSQAQQRRIIELVNEVVSHPKNAPKEGVHWLHFIGGRLSFSAIDSKLLEKPPSVDGPVDGDEPTCQDDALCLSTACRAFSSDREREQVLEGRRPSNFTCPKCSGHTFGSYLSIDSKLIRHCNGRGQRVNFKDGKAVPVEGPDEPTVRCDFTWPESDDRKYGLKPP